MTHTPPETIIPTTTDRRTGVRALLLAALTATLAATAPPARALELSVPADDFPLPAGLEPNVRFWIDVFTQYGSDQVVLHDEERMEIVYAVLDFSRLEEERPGDPAVRLERRRRVDDLERRYRTLLQGLARSPAAADDAEGRRLEALLAPLPGGRQKFASAAGRLRTQTGLRDRFATAIARSGLYLPAMELVFARRGLPVELTRMVFVESMFQETARSKVGAGGMWQIMPATARQLLEMGAETDDRYDPLRATAAAAAILAENREALGNWPLAVTAYNAGKNGLVRTVRNLGTNDPAVVLREHRSRTFGFASRNFYAELLAAAHVHAERHRFFPGIEPLPPLRFETWTLPAYAPAEALASAAGVELDALVRLNPGFNREVWRGDLWLPAGRELRVPEGSLGAFERAWAALPAKLTSEHQVGLRYRVRPGDTLSAIARRHGTTVAALQRANGLASAHRIRVGQVLLIGGRAGAAAAGQMHLVARGDTLSAIARRYGTCVDSLRRANGLGASDHLAVGQRLAVPAGCV